MRLPLPRASARKPNRIVFRSKVIGGPIRDRPTETRKGFIEGRRTRAAFSPSPRGAQKSRTTNSVANLISGKRLFFVIFLYFFCLCDQGDRAPRPALRGSAHRSTSLWSRAFSGKSCLKRLGVNASPWQRAATRSYAQLHFRIRLLIRPRRLPFTPHQLIPVAAIQGFPSLPCPQAARRLPAGLGPRPPVPKKLENKIQIEGNLDKLCVLAALRRCGDAFCCVVKKLAEPYNFLR